jgi:hypothetical protein
MKNISMGFAPHITTSKKKVEDTLTNPSSPLTIDKASTYIIICIEKVITPKIIPIRENFLVFLRFAKYNNAPTTKYCQENKMLVNVSTE